MLLAPRCGSTSWATQSCTLTPVTGVHTLYVVFDGAAPQDGRLGTNSGDRGLHPLIEMIGEHGRRFEEALSSLEQSLTALFTTQIETLQRLRDQARDHYRRWAEQAANRRTAFSPP